MPVTTHLVHSDAELRSTFNAAQDGDIIQLAAGAVFTGDKLQGRDFATGLTITSADPNNRAVFANTTLEFRDVSGVTLTGIDFLRDNLADARTGPGLVLRDTADITVRDVEFRNHIPTVAEGADPLADTTNRHDSIAGFGVGTAMRVMASSGTTIENVEIHDFRTAISLQTSDSVTLTDLDIHEVREGITLFDMDDTIIQNSHLHDFKPWWNGSSSRNDHPDMIQFWGLNSSSGVHDLTIQGNLFDQPAGWTQTIFGHLRHAGVGVTATGFQITDNIIINGHVNAIALGDVSDVVIDNNLMLSNDPDSANNIDFPRIILNRTANVTVTDNILPVYGPKGVVLLPTNGQQSRDITLDGNVLLPRDSSLPNNVGDILDMVRTSGTSGVTTVLIDAINDLLSGGGTSAPDTGTVPDPGTSVTPDPNPVLGASIHLEAGTVTTDQTNSNQWHSVIFDEAISDARVVMGPISYDGTDPAVTRVRNVTDTGFEFQIDEWDYRDGAHIAETISWIAASEGTYALEDGQTISVGRLIADDPSEALSLSGFNQSPAVFAQVTSDNDASTVTTRVSNVSAAGFSVQIQEQEGNTGAHLSETIDWFAIDYGAGTNWSSALASDINHTPTTVASGLAGDDFVFIAGMQTANGPDTAALRYDLTAAGTRIFVEEERSADFEVNHALEDVAFLALNSGSLALYDFLP